MFRRFIKTEEHRRCRETGLQSVSTILLFIYTYVCMCVCVFFEKKSFERVDESYVAMRVYIYIYIYIYGKW